VDYVVRALSDWRLLMRLNSEFTSYQGTGKLTGVRQYFVRFQGCSVKCPIRRECDEQGALSVKGGYESRGEDVLTRAAGHEWLHMTGGEPLEQVGAVDWFIDHWDKTHLQTSGTIAVSKSPYYLTVSPKTPRLIQTSGDEMVVVLAPWVTAELLVFFRRSTSFDLYYLQPLWVGGECNAEDTVKLCNQLDGWRVAGQLHKYLGLE